MSSSKKFRTLLASLMIGTLRLIGRCRLSTIQRIGWVLGTVLGYLPTQFREVSRKNIALCFPHQDQQWQDTLVRDSLRNTTITMLEYAMNWFWPMDKIMGYIATPDPAAFERFEKARAHGKGLILLSPHMGSWETMLGYLPTLGEATMMYRPLRMASLEEVVRTARERAGAHLVPATAGGIRDMLKTLKRNGIVVMLPDQVPMKSGGVMAPFFGVPALTMTLAAKLAARTGARVLVGYSARLGLGEGFKPDCVDVSDAIYGDDDVAAACAMNTALETVILHHPDQYVWSYKRFKRNGERVY